MNFLSQQSYFDIAIKLLHLLSKLLNIVFISHLQLISLLTVLKIDESKYTFNVKVWFVKPLMAYISEVLKKQMFLSTIHFNLVPFLLYVIPKSSIALQKFLFLMTTFIFLQFFFKLLKKGRRVWFFRYICTFFRKSENFLNFLSFHILH